MLTPAVQAITEALRCAAANGAQRSLTAKTDAGASAAPHALQSAMTQSAHGRDEHAAAWSVLQNRKAAHTAA